MCSSNLSTHRVVCKRGCVFASSRLRLPSVGILFASDASAQGGCVAVLDVFDFHVCVRAFVFCLCLLLLSRKTKNTPFC